MNEIFLLYLWTRLDALVSLSTVLFFCSIVVFTIGGRFYVDVLSPFNTTREEDAKIARKITKYSLYSAVVFGIIAVLLPTKKDAAIIAGGWVVSKAAQSEMAKEIGDKTWRIIQGKLDEQLKELEGGKK